MLIILFLFALIRTFRSSPLPSPDPILDNLGDICIRETRNHIGNRTVNDIVISCFATIFACTWKAIHPNIPAPADCWWTRFKRQVTIMVYSLLAPELITIWALRQRLTAKQIMDDYNMILEESDTNQPTDAVSSTAPSAILGAAKYIPSAIHALFHDSPPLRNPPALPRWTMAHGFFLQMGGFMLTEDGKPLHTLYDGILGLGVPAEGALLTEIRRQTIDPPRITEEDIMDRSKGDIISKTVIVLQTTWFIIQCIARWAQHLPVTELEVVTLGFATLNGVTFAFWWHKPQNVQRPVFLERKERGDPPPDPVFLIGLRAKKSWVRETIARVANTSVFLLPITAPFYIYAAFLRPLMKLGTHYRDYETFRVSMFHSAEDTSDTASWIGITSIGALFGCVHLIPSWFLDYATHQEMWLWRVSAVIITAIPMCIGASKSFDKNKAGYISNAVLVISLVLYPIARIILLLLSLTALRSLPPGAFQTIEWTTFIPHL